MTNRYALPLPPSANSHWRAIGRGRVIISAAGRDYRKSVWGLCIETGQMTLTGRIAVTVAATFARHGKSDLDNRLKPLLDALQYGGAYEDDSQIDDLRIYRVGIEKPGGVIVTIEPLPDAVSPRWVLDNIS